MGRISSRRRMHMDPKAYQGKKVFSKPLPPSSFDGMYKPAKGVRKKEGGLVIFEGFHRTRVERKGIKGWKEHRDNNLVSVGEGRGEFPQKGKKNLHQESVKNKGTRKKRLQKKSGHRINFGYQILEAEREKRFQKGRIQYKTLGGRCICLKKDSSERKGVK